LAAGTQVLPVVLQCSPRDAAGAGSCRDYDIGFEAVDVATYVLRAVPVAGGRMAADECGLFRLDHTGLRTHTGEGPSTSAWTGERTTAAWHHRRVKSWPNVITIEPIDRATGRVRLPGSKSISNRALLLSALAEGTTVLVDVLDADDTRVMRDALATLGVQFAPVDGSLSVEGCSGRFPRREGELFLGNAGTAFRSLTAALAFSGGRYALDGVPRMRERPIEDLVDALNVLGARISYSGRVGFPPLRIEPADRLASDRVAVRGDVSSQFLSGLLMAAPMVAPAAGLRIAVEGNLISQPYVTMTTVLMRRFGVDVQDAGGEFVVPPATYRSPGRFVVEGDASGASYFLALGAIAGGPVRVEGVGRDSVQGDVRFADALAAMGAEIEVGENYIESRSPVPAGCEGSMPTSTTSPMRR
jgi:3-phosphoshikimate 1-carboxyvinyltransferase